MPSRPVRYFRTATARNIDSLRPSPRGQQQGVHSAKTLFPISSCAHRIGSRYGVSDGRMTARAGRRPTSNQTALSSFPFSASFRCPVPETIARAGALSDTMRTQAKHSERRGHAALNKALFILKKNGTPNRIRTCDLLIKSQLLYRLSYGRAEARFLVDCARQVNALQPSNCR